MILILCVDDCLGIAFNKRCQSRDKILDKKILEIVGESMLWMAPSTKKRFPDKTNIAADEEFLMKAGEESFCFVEKEEIQNLDNVEKVIMFHWNRSYPADLYFDTTLLSGWEKIETEDFEGKSHKKITKEIYCRR